MRGEERRGEKRRGEVRNKVSLCHKLKEKSQLLSSLSPFVLRGCVPSHLLYLDSELEWQQRGGGGGSLVHCFICKACPHLSVIRITEPGTKGII